MKIDRIGRRLLLVAGLIDAALGEFAGVVVIVLADADHVLRERADRGGELGAGKRDRRPIVERLALAHQLDDMAQVAQRAAADRKRPEAVALDGAENLALRAVDGCNFHGRNADLAGMAVRRRDARKALAKTAGPFKPISHPHTPRARSTASIEMRDHGALRSRNAA